MVSRAISPHIGRTLNSNQEVFDPMRLIVIERLARQVFRVDPKRAPATATDTLSLTTPVEHSSLTSLCSHIAASAKGEVFAPAGNPTGTH